MDLLGAYGSEDEEEPKQTEPSPAILNQSNPQPAQPPARKKIKIVVKEESASLSDDEISPVNSTNGTGGLFSRLPKPVHASTKAAKIIPIAVKKKAVVEKKIEESFFTIATRKESDEIIQPTHIGPRNVSKSASSAYSSTYAVNTYNEPTNPAQERIDSSMGLIPTQEKKRMADNFTIVDIKQDDVIGSWESDRLKSMSQTQRAEALASVQSNGEQGGGSLLSMAQEAARDQMALKEKAASRRTNQIKTQRKYGF